MKCPKCSASFNATPDEGGFFACPGCGVRLRSRPAPAPGVTLDTVLAEIGVVRGLQEEALSLLRGRPQGDAARVAGETREAVGEEAPPRPSIRARRHKTVLMIDDQDDSRQAAVAALDQAQVPTRAFSDGPRGLEALAAERSDVIVLELGIGGAMAGKDVINMVKATMEWVDIPIVLHTRLPIESQKEARTIHGADEFIIKAAGSAEALVARVIQLFRRG